MAGSGPRSTPNLWVRALLLLGVMGVLAAIVFLVYVVSDLGDTSDSFSPDDLVAENESLLDQLPMLPGAELLSTNSDTYQAGDSLSPVEGVATKARFQTSSGTSTEDVLSFYESNLGPAWSCERKGNPEVGLSLRCRREPSALTVVVPQPQQQAVDYFITVDSDVAYR